MKSNARNQRLKGSLFNKAGHDGKDGKLWDVLDRGMKGDQPKAFGIKLFTGYGNHTEERLFC